MSTWYARQNDTLGTIRAQLLDENGAAVDLTNAVGVDFHMKPRDGALKVDGACTIVDAVNGIVQWAWEDAPTGLDTAGVFDVEWQVTYTGGGIQTHPNVGSDKVRVSPELG